MQCPRCWKERKVDVQMKYKNYKEGKYEGGVDTFSCPYCNYTLIEVIHE